MLIALMSEEGYDGFEETETDLQAFIPEEEFDKIKGLKVLILDALRYRPHETHFSIDEAVGAAQKINAKQTYFTHMTHDIVHDEANKKLPSHIEFAYDGLECEV